MPFKKKKYIKEMHQLVDKGIEKMMLEHKDFEVFTMNIWTDPDAAASSINFDTKENSIKAIEKANEWNKTYYDKYMMEDNVEQAQLFTPISIESRNSDPANFLLTDFMEMENASIPLSWEESSDGACWDILEPLLKDIGVYALAKTAQLTRHPDFELSVNGREDWYQFTWKKG